MVGARWPRPYPLAYQCDMYLDECVLARQQLAHDFVHDAAIGATLKFGHQLAHHWPHLSHPGRLDLCDNLTRFGSDFFP